MKRVNVFLLLLFLAFLSACATIPQESVDLSSEVGIGLQKQHQAQIDLINLHFSIIRKSLDDALSRSIDKYFVTLTPSGSITLNKTQLVDVANDVMLLNRKNNAAKEELEKARVLLLKKLNDNYLILNQANSSVTGLLQSAVTVKEARSEAYEKLSEATDGRIELDKIFSELDDFLLKNGEEAGKVIKLVDKLESLMKEKESEK